MDANGIVRATKKGLGIELDVKDDAQSIIDEYKQQDNVKLDKEFLGIESKRVSIIVEEVLDINDNIKKEVIEDVKLSKENILN
jgi:hypothetical protein